VLYDGSEASLSTSASMTTMDHKFWSSRGKSDAQAPQVGMQAWACTNAREQCAELVKRMQAWACTDAREQCAELVKRMQAWACTDAREQCAELVKQMQAWACTDACEQCAELVKQKRQVCKCDAQAPQVGNLGAHTDACLLTSARAQAAGVKVTLGRALPLGVKCVCVCVCVKCVCMRVCVIV